MYTVFKIFLLDYNIKKPIKNITKIRSYKVRKLNVKHILKMFKFYLTFFFFILFGLKKSIESLLILVCQYYCYNLNINYFEQ